MKTGLKEGQPGAIVKVLSSHRAGERAVIFGSRATDGFKREPGVDIALFGPEPTLSDLARLAPAMDALTVPQRFDLLDKIENLLLREPIEKEGIELFNRRSGPAWAPFVLIFPSAEGPRHPLFSEREVFPPFQRTPDPDDS